MMETYCGWKKIVEYLRNQTLQALNPQSGHNTHPSCLTNLISHSGHVGRTLVKIQTLIYDRNVYQDFSVPSKGTYGKKIFKNFIESI